MTSDPPTGPPARLRALASWQTNKVSVLGARMTAARMPLGSRSDFAVLSALEEYGELSQSQLGRCLGLDRNDVNAIVTRLDGRGDVDRRPDPSDGRRNIVSLTMSGRNALSDLHSQADSVNDELLASLSHAERKQLQGLLDTVLSAHPTQPS